MKPKQLILRCYAEKKGTVWQAFCLDLNLAAQDSSFIQARNRLHAQIESYVEDAVTGEDATYADQLLSRKAPWPCWIKYYYLCAVYGAGAAKNSIMQLFTEVMPIHLGHNCPYKHA